MQTLNYNQLKKEFIQKQREEDRRIVLERVYQAQSIASQRRRDEALEEERRILEMSRRISKINKLF